MPGNIYVVGSGPAGVSVATGLLASGARVTMLDAGVLLEPGRQEIVRRLATTRPEAWAAADLARIREGMTPTASGVPLKYTYGSDFPYRETEGFVPLHRAGVDSAVSFGRGGFSTVWGAAVLPYNDRDLGHWPITAADLAPHYRAVLGFMPVSATNDSLGELFPLHLASPRSVAPSRQAAALLADLEREHAALVGEGIRFGRSRIALCPDAPPGRSGCIYCGLCLYGCPHELIYSSAATLEQLRASPDFRYIPGVVLERVEERDSTVRLHTRRLEDGTRAAVTGERVYLACGPVSTTRLLMASMELYDTPVTLQDSQYFLFPLLRFKGVRDVRTEPLHTLAQAFVEILDPAVSPHTVHLQVYTYSDMYDVALRGLVGPLYGAASGPAAHLLGRMLIVQGYLHSDHSPRITLRLSRGSGDEPSPLEMTATHPAEPVRATLARVLRKLWRARGAFRAVPLAPMLRIAGPGRGFHTGGSFPMTRAPSSEPHSDLLGRPDGFTRVHAVDATVFPDIPATTITLTVMANAHRIGSHFRDS